MPFSLVLLLFLWFGAASAASYASLFFYQHIAKTGGTSWSWDLATLGPLKHCGTSHLVGPTSLTILNSTLAQRLASSEPSPRAHGGSQRCNLFNREDGLAASLRVFAYHGVTPKLILMLRSPVTQVRSMYSHCLGPTGFLRLQKQSAGVHVPDLSLSDWLTLFTNSSSPWNQRGAWKYCYYNPVNYQTHILAAPSNASINDDFVFPSGRFAVPAAAVARVYELVQEAFFVGVTDYYAHCVCLIRWLVTGQSPASDCARTASADMAHADYGNTAAATTLSGAELALITQVSRIDELVYGFALGRFYRDVSKANLQLARRA